MQITTIKYLSALILLLLLCLFLGCDDSRPVRQASDGVIVPLKEGILKLQACSSRIIRVCYDPTGKFTPEKSLVVDAEWQPVDFQVIENRKNVQVSTDSLITIVNRKTGAVRFLDIEENLLFQEDSRDPRYMEPAVVLGDTTHHAGWNIEFSDDEGIYGPGQFETGVMNWRGHCVKLTQENTKVALPFFISTRNYGVLMDNYSKIIFNDQGSDSYFWFEVGDVIYYYFIAGENMDEVIRGYRQATGDAPLFGKWAYGYWQSRERYKIQAEVLKIAREFRERRIPVDNIMQDWQYWGDVAHWSSLQFDPQRYPAPQAMIDRLHNQYHLHLMISIWPVLGYATDVYRELDSAGLLYRPFHWTDGHTYDAYSKTAREIYWKHVKKNLFSKGVDAYWMDGTEPEIFVAPHERSTKSAQKNALGTMARYLNTYSLMATEAVYTGQRSASSDERVFILTRSAFPGQQRNSAATWSGDIVAGWQTLRNQIPAGLNFCMAGIPYWSNDIGGFHVYRHGAFAGGCDNPGYKELYVRWFQYGAFQPIFRSHGTDTPREPWRFGEPGSWAYDTILKYLRLRYRLLPYIYSLAWRVTADGYTIMRGLPMDFSDDKLTHAVSDQYMFGSALMVCPVTEHMYYGKSYYNEAVPSECLLTEDGQPGGFTARYYTGRNYDTLMVDSILTIPEFDVYLGKDLPPQVHWDRNSMRWTGFIRPKTSGEYTFWLTSDDAVRFWFDGKLLVDRWNNLGEDKTNWLDLSLMAGKKYAFRVDQAHMAAATKLRLAWRTPAMKSRTYDPATECGTRSVYLPKSAEWYDFWTGEKFSGGQTIERETPIDIMPLYVRAGSILPMGSQQQYIEEKPADPIEIRIYCGADVTFNLYEDEGDNYNHEKGLYSIIPFEWNDRDRVLTIGNRRGNFPGMLIERGFDIVWVRDGHGTGIEATAFPDTTVLYKGEKIVIEGTNEY